MLIRTIFISTALGASMAWMLSAPAHEHHTPDAVTADSGRYYGPLVNGKLHGRGRMEWGDGSRYEGEFSNGFLSGNGKHTDSTGRVYEGQFQQGLFNGKGRYDTADGEVYEGDFVRNQFTGVGNYKRQDGVHYEGHFLKWRFHGEGRYSDGSGLVYEGNFTQGDFSGKGRMSGKDSGDYEGEFKNWRPHGSGVMRLPNGDVYTGAFSNGLYHGKGTLRYTHPLADGRTQEQGEWRDGELQNPRREFETKLNVESALYRQRTLLDRAIAALTPRIANKINMYLLAVGGDGTQEVFRREVDFVSDQFLRRFDTKGHTLALVNSRNTGGAQPMATMTSIQESLNAIGTRMDKESDILFLFITSHGSKHHEISLEQDAMRLRDLPAAELGRMLKQSGIRWKVILLSACYSGGFIDSLKDDQTLIITAARHDRRSFGCSDDNDFTYFGRAYFKESLPRSASFQEAFQRAEKLVREWERKDIESQGKTAEEEYSYPQMFSPAPAEKYLRQWWAQQGSLTRTVENRSGR